MAELHCKEEKCPPNTEATQKEETEKRRGEGKAGGEWRKGGGRGKKDGVREGEEERGREAQDTRLTINVTLCLQSENTVFSCRIGRRGQRRSISLSQMLSNWRKIPDRDVEMQVAEEAGSNQTCAECLGE